MAQNRLSLTAVTLLLLLAVVACRRDDPRPSTDVTENRPDTSEVAGRPDDPRATFTPTAPPRVTATPSNTPTSSPTPTITPTPTPTAPSMNVAGVPLASLIEQPAPRNGAACGVVDFLDFPVDPPDGDAISSGGHDFGRFRNRYDGFHAGEDWWGVDRRSSFGTPVYSIGHGTVTYAHPLGWGIDQGTVIIRHVLPSGQTFLSFYGHLDPPSIELRPGDCVRRGDQIGAIGDPRSSPHLHFEIRSHMPGEPGPGYWSVDPRLSGWEWPSQYIWNNRIAVSPGVTWLRPFTASGTRALGMLEDGTLVVLEDGRIQGVNIGDGGTRWRFAPVEEMAGAALDVVHPLIYLVDRSGLISAFAQLNPAEPGAAGFTPLSPEPLWEVELDTIGAPQLIPLPQGGVVLSGWGQMAAISPEGRILWQEEVSARPLDWLVLEGQLLLATRGTDSPLWTVDQAGATPWDNAKAGHLVAAGARILLYDTDGIYRLDPQTQEIELFYALPHALLARSDLIALDDGSVLVSHVDPFDHRLLLLDPAGQLRWERSFSYLNTTRSQLLLSEGRPYMLLEHDRGSSSKTSVYAIDVDQILLTRLFLGGTRLPVADDTWALTVDRNRILVNIGGGSLVSLDLQSALAAVAGNIERPDACDILDWTVFSAFC